MRNCAILSIGSELLEGSVVDTNSAYLANKLASLGIKVGKVEMVPDDRQTLLNVLKATTDKYSLVLTTGGLGPTFDDITAECVAEFAGTTLEHHEEVYANMVALLTKANVEIHDAHKRQALLPSGAETYKNYSGTAYGFGVACNNSFIISMPGVPSEMKTMFERSVAPYLEENNYTTHNYNKIVTFASLPESDVDKAISELGIPENVECIINVGKGIVQVKLRGHEQISIDNFIEKLIERFTCNFVGYNSDTLVSVLISKLKHIGATLAIAESCTGGLLSKEVTDIAGVSSVYLGSVTSYANSVKENMLGVDSNALKQYGAVSEQVAKQMAHGVMDALGADYAISTTGVAGPDGGTDEKPVGTVYIAYGKRGDVEVKRLQLRGSRDDIRVRATNIAIYSLFNYINNRGSK